MDDGDNPGADEAVERQLRRAEAICAERGTRFTPMRREVYRFLLEAAQPRTAYALIDMLSARCARRVSPPTVYRALDFLVDQGLVLHLQTCNAYLACAQPYAVADRIVFLCTGCGRAFVADGEAAMSAVCAAAREQGFAPLAAVLEVPGVCRDCL